MNPTWTNVLVKDITLKIRMWNPQKEHRNSIKYVDVSAVAKERSEIIEVEEYKSNSVPGRARKIILQDDVIFATIRPGLKRIAKVPPYLNNELASTAFCVLRPDIRKIEPDFLFYSVLNEEFINAVVNLETGASYPAVRDCDITEQKIPLPPLNEQYKISRALNLIRASLLHQYQSLSIAQELKYSAMHHLFTRGLRGEPKKETEIGMIPESWEILNAEKIFKLTSGKTRPLNLSSTRSETNPFPVLGGNGIIGYSTDWFIDNAETLVIGRVGEYCGAIHISYGKAWITDNALYAKEWLIKKINTKFIAEYLTYYDLNRFKRAAGQPLVTQGIINEHCFPIPSLKEQHEIADILDAIDQKIDLHKRKKALLEELFKSLLHKLMTGEILVADLDLSALEEIGESK